MLTLNPIFSDHALFQCSSVLTLRGHCSPGSSLKVEIVRMGIVSCTAAGTAAQDGTFALAINTPDGSFDAYEITVTDGTNTVTCTDVLFGELWLASGQSNMELTCEFQPECDSMLEQLRGSGVRVYSVAYAKPNTDGLQFSRTPEEDTPGEWFTDDTVEKWKHVSACATSFVLNIARYYKKTGKSVPIGFLNASWGGTPIFSWLPLDVIDADERCCAYLTDAGFYPIDEKWNTFKNNTHQPGVMYNRKIGPLIGVRVRGIIWYQGENEVCFEPTWRIYAHAQRLYYQHYAKMFAADERAFVVLSSLIFPWAYGESGECMRSYLNRALIENTKLYPERFVFCPNDDLRPVWAPNLNNE
ncbi:MAG: hypothetical protein J6S76_00080, partial [Clostridia bacterium]|nr:hypothetical protein [Clostridia bacterium]